MNRESARPAATIARMPEHLQLPVADLKPFHRNPRRGNIDEIAKSLTKHGQYRTIVVNAGTHTGRPMEVLAGNHTMLAARSLGWPMIDATLIDVDEDTANSIVAADNRLADLGDYDSSDLYALLSSVTDLDGTGYTESQPGQVWELGEHRLLVGSATDETAVRLMCAGVRPDVVWTDPPYGVDYVGKTKAALRIQNDGAGGLLDLLTPAFEVIAAVCQPGSPVHIACPPGPEFATFVDAMRAAGLSWRQTLIWVKNALVLGRSDYHYQHEPVLYGFTPGGEGRKGRGGARWFGDNKQTSIFEVARPARSEDHPTMKPVGLITAMLSNSLPPGGVVFDPFAGSGSTLIAAHGLRSRAFCVELDPAYADVILRRFEEHTGMIPTLDGEPVSFAGTRR